MEHQVSAAKQAVVIGGSLGGLFAGLLLRSIGWDVDIYERSPQDLDSRGSWRRRASRFSCVRQVQQIGHG
jgi:2-polyprenyl-6-methoxyphenol hydroxylase-like FAD-dependent oxidoreductase